MSKRDYRRVRSIPDKVLGATLVNHSGALHYVVNRIAAYDRYRWVRRGWYAFVTAALVYLLKGHIRTWLVVLF